MMERTAGARSAAQKLPASGKGAKQAKRSTRKRSKGTGRGSATPVPDFSSDEERYEWEILQRFERMDNMDRWLSAEDIYVIGPPLPPNCKIFVHKVATEAFKLATAQGYVAVRPACAELGMGRFSVRRMIDKIPALDIAYVVYDGKKERSRYHCRMLHKKSLRMIKRDPKHWVKESKRGGEKTTAENIRRSC